MKDTINEIASNFKKDERSTKRNQVVKEANDMIQKSTKITPVEKVRIRYFNARSVSILNILWRP